jgi:uncharacterized circularly permuted ATP-grasp superfamily protein/uncharacterized alpha-E superfamily protein
MTGWIRNRTLMAESQFQSMTGSAAEAPPAAEGLPIVHGRAAAAFDEMLDEKGRVRPHYAKLISELEGIGGNELVRRAEASRRLVREHGMSYNVYGDLLDMERPWRLDPVPFVISSDEWRVLEAGLIQRATLLNRILADCYGSQDLIRSRLLSPALVFAQPDFLRPCHNIRMAGGTFLHFYAADLARSPDGRWWVTSDRTQIPTGAGYALGNRLVTSRILPELFRENHVLRLAGFFREVKAALARLAPHPADKARVVLLTPGPHNETYFEQAFLARYLGYALVEGQDLTVRDDRVFLKTLSGLEPVDVIWRRVDDDFCDPLELRNDSILGVPGLVQALRAGNVSVANSLGSGLLQSPAFLSFLPGLCRQLLGEELKLPSVATWWCGQKSARKYVCEHLGELVVKPAFRAPTWSVDGDKRPTSAEAEELRRRIEFDPDMFVAQERVELSTAPCWDGKGLTARPIGLRAYAVAGAGGYHVMPGGLSHVAPDHGSLVQGMQRGASSKDTWVASPAAAPEVTLFQTEGQRVELHRTGNNLPSRLADHFFWLGRYSERADATARMLRSAVTRFIPQRTASARPLLQTLSRQGQMPDFFRQPEPARPAGSLEAELLGALWDPRRSGSLRSIIDRVQQLGVFVRDRTSNDMWHALSQLGERVAEPADSADMLAGDAIGILNQTLLGLAAFHGLARENMTRAQAWRFLDMGLRIERTIYLCILLDVTLQLPEPADPSVLEAVLEATDTTITFRSRYNLLPSLPAVFDLVLLDDKNPRSVLFQINQLLKHFELLPPEREASEGSGRSILQACLARLSGMDVGDLAGRPESWLAGGVSRGIRETLGDLPRLSDAIAANYFAHSTISHTGRNGGS